ncbi:DUF4388 domain-containing protein [Deinococcus malanensis]|uniref:DUF4388 domain-containing protein n=1 Tax=Deinococcus malanensis TaxID=1706855 RepID=UPI003639DF7B
MVRGDLTVFPLLSVMQMLLASGRAGRLSLDHPRGGQLWLDPGELVHAQAWTLSGDAGLQVVCSVTEGTFVFEADEPAPNRTLALRRDAALRRMLDDHESWTPSFRHSRTGTAPCALLPAGPRRSLSRVRSTRP